MAVRRPLVNIAGQLQELPQTDTLPGAGGSVTIKNVTVTVTYGVSDYLATVTDAAVSPTSNVMLTHGAYSQQDVNTAGANLNVESVATGSFTVRISSPDASPLGGPYKLSYLLG